MPEGRAQYDVGILFVHGIGEQPRADTLVRFGDPLCTWIERWCAGTSSPGYDQPVAMRALLRPPPEDPEARPYAELRVCGPAAGGTTKETYWLLAECWWAETFATPRYLDLVKWSFGVVPWTIQSHFGTRVRRAAESVQGASSLGLRIWRALGYSVDAVFLVLSPFLAAVVLLLASLLLLLALPPIPRLRTFLVKVQRKLAATVGDSYVLLSSPVQAAAIADQVNRDLHWLIATKNCRAVALVAHSQGAAVAHEALRRVRPPGLTKDNCLLFTFGSGLNKLEELRQAKNSGRIKSAWLALLGAPLVVWGTLLRWFGLLVPGNIDAAFWGGMALISGYVLWVVGMIITYKGPDFPEGEFEPARRFGVALPWMDYYASLDPVPNGPLYDEDQTPPYLKGNSVEVHNRCAVLRDHNSYWKNPDAFIGAVACAVGRLAGLELDQVKARDREWLILARLRRRWRVRWLATARFLAGISAVVLPLAFRKELAGLGAWVLPDLSQQAEKVPGTLSGAVESSQRFLALLQAHPAWLGGVLLVALVFTVYAVLYGLWKWWEADDIGAFFRRKSFWLGWPFLLFVGSTVLLADMVFLASVLLVAPRGFFASWWGLTSGILLLVVEVYAILGPAENFLEERGSPVELAKQLEPDETRNVVDNYTRRAIQPELLNELIEVSRLAAPAQARRILEGPAEVFPEAAVALANLLAHEEPEKAKEILRRHAEKDATARQALDKLSSGSAKP